MGGVKVALYKNEIRLSKPQDVRRMLSRVINYLLMNGDMTNEKAKAINALSNTALKSMEMGELQEELEHLKEVIEGLEVRNR
jgi:polyhydroxyalkanoate synthesis regulator phasin